MEAIMASGRSIQGACGSLGLTSVAVRNRTVEGHLRSSFFSARLKRAQSVSKAHGWSPAARPSCPSMRRRISVVSETAVSRGRKGASSTLARSREAEQANFRPKHVLSRTKKALSAPKIEGVAVPKLDRFGRLRTPRAARELALSVLYAAFVSGVHPLKVFDERLKERAAGVFDKSQLEGYEHCSDVGENLVVEDEATATALEEALEAEASLEASVLTAPPPVVYNNFVIRLARSLVKDTAERWLQQEVILMEIIPAKWKAEPKGALLQLCILQLALAEIETTDIPPSVVVNETVELAKRFCDLAAPRIVNGCLGSYIRRRQIRAKKPAASVTEKLEKELVSEPLQPEDLGFADDY